MKYTTVIDFYNNLILHRRFPLEKGDCNDRAIMANRKR